jgi:hypothetical protein
MLTPGMKKLLFLKPAYREALCKVLYRSLVTVRCTELFRMVLELFCVSNRKPDQTQRAVSCAYHKLRSI